MNVILVVAFWAVAVTAEFKLDPMCTEMPSPPVDSAKCCRIPEVTDDKIMEKCAMKVFGGSTPPAPPSAPMASPASSQSAEVLNLELLFSPTIRCLAECIFNETGILKDRVLQTDVAISQSKAFLQNEQEWIPVFEMAIKSCKDFVSKVQFDDQKACGHVASYLIGCFNTQLFKNCPASKWKDEPGCAQLRASTDKCPVLPAVLQNQQ